MKLLIPLLFFITGSLFAEEVKNDEVAKAVKKAFAMVRDGKVSQDELESLMIKQYSNLYSQFMKMNGILKKSQNETVEMIDLAKKAGEKIKNLQEKVKSQRARNHELQLKLAKWTAEDSENLLKQMKQNRANELHELKGEIFNLNWQAKSINHAMNLAVANHEAGADKERSKMITEVTWTAIDHCALTEESVRSHLSRCSPEEIASLGVQTLADWEQSQIIGDELIVKIRKIGFTKRQKERKEAMLIAREKIRDAEKAKKR